MKTQHSQPSVTDMPHTLATNLQSVVYPGHHIASGKEVAIKALSSRGGSGEVAIRNKLGYHPSVCTYDHMPTTATFSVLQ